jgi:arginine exporter protein ArgO
MHSPFFGVSLISVSFFLKLIGILSPVMAFVGIMFGVFATFHSWHAKRTQEERETIEKQKALIELKTAEIKLKQLESGN